MAMRVSGVLKIWIFFLFPSSLPSSSILRSSDAMRYAVRPLAALCAPKKVTALKTNGCRI